MWQSHQLLRRWWGGGGGGGGESWMLWRACVCQMCCWTCCGNMKPWQYGLQQRKMKAKTDRNLSLRDHLICAIFSAALSSERCSRRTSDNQGLEGAARAGLEERGQIRSRQEVKVENKVLVAVFTCRAEKWVGEEREEDGTEERCEGEREQRFRLKVTGRGVGGSAVARCRLTVMK